MDVLVHGKYNWQPTNDENENSQKDQAVDGDDIVVEERLPGTNGTEPHKYSQVE